MQSHNLHEALKVYLLHPKLIDYTLLNLNEQPAISSGFSWGAWIRTKILSSRGICPAVGRLPKTANILPLFSSFVGNSMAAVYSINYRKGKSQLHWSVFYLYRFYLRAARRVLSSISSKINRAWAKACRATQKITPARLGCSSQPICCIKSVGPPM